MSFRVRLLLAFVAAVLVPLALFAYGVRREMSGRLTAEYEERVASLVSEIRDDLAAQSQGVGQRLSTLARELEADTRFRLAAGQSEGDRRWLLDYAGDAMRLAGLAMLQVQDSTGRILSSGHFRNDYDRLAPEVPRFLSTAPRGTALVGTALVRVRTPEAPFLALARVDSLAMGGRRFTVVGGMAVDSALLGRLARGRDLDVALVVAGDTVTAGDAAGRDAARPDSAGPGAAGREPTHERVVGEFTLPYIDALADGAPADRPPAADTARFVVTHRLTTLEALRRRVDLWFFAAVGATTALALLLATWLASRVSRPLRDLAQKTATIDLDRLDQDFATDRDDEVGALSRLLGAMTDRLRASTTRLREAERRATVGDLARQVNHDVKNGLAPIRHVVRHLAQVARDEPARLATVFGEREGTLESSLGYLETLAQNYARLSPPTDAEPCDVNAAVRQTLRGVEPRSAELRVQLAEALPAARGSAVMVRRILENLIGNAVDSLESRPGTVSVSTEAVPDNTPPLIRITIADTGRGMSRDELNRAFDDFYTTKPGGTGLGLSVVRRLVMDLEGTLRVETEPGAGTRFIIDLPAVQPTIS